MTDFFSQVIEETLAGKIKNKKQLQARKTLLAGKYGLSKIPTDADILTRAGKHRAAVLGVLQKKPSRTLSGVSVVAVMTKPSACPHGKCVYCPGGVDVETPQSYTGHEPAAMRGTQFNFNAFEQAKNRIEQLELIGHPTDKIELIVMGGTFPAQPSGYQRSFVKGCFDGMNGKRSKTLKEAQLLNEHSRHRCVGLTFETRPDWCKEKQINRILEFGGTRVELGVQNPSDAVYNVVKRGHTVKDVIDATKFCKDSFLKVNYHMMPGLPGSSERKDVAMFKEIFDNSDFRPDMLKIYPCLLIKPEFGETELYKMWKRGEWTPYGDEEASRVIAEAKRYFPRWVRVMRIQRDIPTNLILAGVKSSNLRQLVDEELRKRKAKCECIRCREIRDNKPSKVRLNRVDYEASGGHEVFLSFDDEKLDKIIGFARLRVPDEPFRKEITAKTAGIRELHVYGQSLEIGRTPSVESQHRGYGKRLLEEAERVARDEFGMKKLLVISGVGVRDYYRKLGYKSDGVYVGKPLK
ncbi:tRNA uridine(34) 5-carboxymethylaminomethyl modification radical SAM/GNAT enzyme Elp3 [Candidatus Micrarchaeota archaeon]|nr:tRNA uridine(34) 5-carboxymethylaminomethyl modification radical SAM/GNAT enzyme Elp3 [Candidatus Micrarchaeota archaeon]